MLSGLQVFQRLQHDGPLLSSSRPCRQGSGPDDSEAMSGFGRKNVKTQESYSIGAVVGECDSEQGAGGRVGDLDGTLGLTVIAMCSARFHGLPRLCCSRCREPPILALAPGLHQEILCSAKIRLSSVAAVVASRSAATTGEPHRPSAADVGQDQPNVGEYDVKFDNIEPPMSPTMSPPFDKQSFMSGPGSNQNVADSVQDDPSFPHYRRLGCLWFGSLFASLRFHVHMQGALDLGAIRRRGFGLAVLWRGVHLLHLSSRMTSLLTGLSGVKMT